MNALELIQKSAEIYSHNPAYEDDGVSLTYSEVWQLAQNVAGHLKSSGVRSADRVALFLEDGSDALCALIGTWLAGGIPVPVNRSLNDEKINFIIKQADPHWALVPAEGIGDGVDDSKQIKIESAVTCPPAQINLPELAAGDDAMILYT